MSRSSLLPENYLQLPPHFANKPVIEYVDALLDFCNRYSWLINLQVVDFFVKDLWSMIDPEWREALLDKRVGSDELVGLASFQTCHEEWPQSLKDFVEETRKLSLLREPFLTQSNLIAIDRNFIDGMSEKKTHEVEILSNLIAQLAHNMGINSILDLGAGQGYLSRALAYHHRLHVLAVDSSGVQTCGAKKFQVKSERKLYSRKRNPVNEPQEEKGWLKHVTKEVNTETLTELLTEFEETETNGCMIVGLHACGDLSIDLIKTFLARDEVKAIVCVGCCYNLMSEIDGEEQSNSRQSFPLSAHLLARQAHLGVMARMLACQSPSRWYSQGSITIEMFKHHFFRALFQNILHNKSVLPTSLHIGRLPKRSFDTFKAYTRAALHKASIPAETISIDEAESMEQKYRVEGKDRQVAAFWTIRSLIAPIIEALLLIDRWTTVAEGLQVRLDQHMADNDGATKGAWMWPVFEEGLSPRNLVLVGIK